MSDSFDDEVESWIDRLESKFTGVDEAAAKGLRPANRQEAQEIVTGRRVTWKHGSLIRWPCCHPRAASSRARSSWSR